MREEGCSRNQLHVMMHGKPHGSNMEGELPKAKHTSRMGKPNSEGDVSRTRRPSTVMISGKGMKDLCVLCLCVLCLVCCACVLCLCAVLVWCACVLCLMCAVFVCLLCLMCAVLCCAVLYMLCAVLWSAVLRSAVPACYVLACYVLAVVLCLSCYVWPWWDELGCHTASIERDPEPVWVASECRLTLDYYMSREL